VSGPVENYVQSLQNDRNMIISSIFELWKTKLQAHGAASSPEKKPLSFIFWSAMFKLFPVYYKIHTDLMDRYKLEKVSVGP